MKPVVFVDTNVLLDVLIRREEFYASSLQVWSLAETGQIQAGIAMISFSNSYYIVGRHAGRKNADKAIRLMRDVFVPVDLTNQVLQQAIDAGFKDFEDAIQYFSAIHSQAECLITRNADHFPGAPLSVFSPDEFLANYSFD